MYQGLEDCFGARFDFIIHVFCVSFLFVLLCIHDLMMMLTNMLLKISDLESETKTISEAINTLDLDDDALAAI